MTILLIIVMYCRQYCNITMYCTQYCNITIPVTVLIPRLDIVNQNCILSGIVACCNVLLCIVQYASTQRKKLSGIVMYCHHDNAT
jgi:hypothetical protein